MRSFFRKKTHYERDNLDPSLNKSEIAYSELRKATKSEAKGRVDDAIRTYNQIIKDFPNTDAAKDAQISLDKIKSMGFHEG